MADFSDIKTWVFDLDRTLYPYDHGIYTQMEENFYDFVGGQLKIDRAEAKNKVEGFHRTYGDAIFGLYQDHNIHPTTVASSVFDLHYHTLEECVKTIRALENLPGEKIIFTNSFQPHANHALEKLGLSHIFEHVYDMHWAEFRSKPSRPPYRRLIQEHGFNPQTAVFVEDSPVNLRPAKELGMKTVLVRPHPHREAHDAYIDHHFKTLLDFLHVVMPELK